MPRNKRRTKIILGALLLLFVGGLIWFFRSTTSSPPTVLDNGSVLTIVDAATRPNEEFYVGVPWKRGFALILKNSNSSLKKNFGHVNVTNASAISWQWSDSPKLGIGFLSLQDKIRLVDAQGNEHQPQPFFSFTDKQPSGKDIDCGVFLFNTSLQPPAFLRIYGRDATNEVRFSK